MDYFKVGQRIRELRKYRRISQETLAQDIEISTTHMCHIENGNTKLSLPVLEKLALSLKVPTDFLIFGNEPVSGSEVINNVLKNCTPAQRQIIVDTVVSMKESFDRNM